MKICLFLIPIFTALTGWLSIFLLLHFLFRYLLPKRWQYIQAKITKKMDDFVVPGLLSSKIQEFDLEKEVSPLLDHRLDRLIEQLKKQVPMGEFFLSGTFIERLKARAKEEILQTLPEIKARLMKKAEQELDLRKIIAEQVQRLSFSQFESFVKTECKSDFIKMQAFGLLLGLILGVAESALLFLSL